MFWRRPPAPTNLTAPSVEYSDPTARDAAAREAETRQVLSDGLRGRLLARDAQQRQELARMGVGTFQRDLDSIFGKGGRHD